ANSAREFLDTFDHVNRNADGPVLVVDCPGHRLADPPCRIRGELVPSPILELLDSPHQAEVSLLNELEQWQAAMQILLGDGNDEPKVCDHEFVSGLFRRRSAIENLAENLLELGLRGAESFFESREGPP